MLKKELEFVNKELKKSNEYLNTRNNFLNDQHWDDEKEIDKFTLISKGSVFLSLSLLIILYMIATNTTPFIGLILMSGFQVVSASYLYRVLKLKSKK